MRSTLLAAQRTAKEIVSEAEQKRDAIAAEADARKQSLVADAETVAKQRMAELEQQVADAEKSLADTRARVAGEMAAEEQKLEKAKLAVSKFMAVTRANCEEQLKILSRLEELEPERGETSMEHNVTAHHSLILVVVNQGYTDAVMDTARAVGARGGTVIRARWTGAGEVEKFVGITLQAEKEVLAIVAPARERNIIMEEIDRVHGLRTSAQGMVISLPIEQTARLD